MGWVALIALLCLVIIAFRLLAWIGARNRTQGTAQWFLLPPGNEGKRGPFTLRELQAELRELDGAEGVRIRSTSSHSWLTLDAAGAVFPSLVKAGVCELPEDAGGIREKHESRERRNSPEVQADTRGVNERRQHEEERRSRYLARVTGRAGHTPWPGPAVDAPDEVTKTVSELERLLKRAMKWATQNDFPPYERYPQYGLIREIGHALHERHGLEGMQYAFYTLAERIPEEADMLHHLWDGIGGWRK